MRERSGRGKSKYLYKVPRGMDNSVGIAWAGRVGKSNGEKLDKL